MGKMMAARVHGLRDLRLEEVDRPALVAGSLRIRVRACAICGSDKRILNTGDFRVQYPVIIGHEIAGEVESVDASITDFKVGDRVCVAPGYSCGRCRNCARGNPNLCLNPYPSLGYALDGGFAEYMSVPEHLYRMGFVNKIPDALSFEQASLAEIVACALNAHRRVRVQPGDEVLIFGAGPAGIINACLAKMNGAASVTLAQRGAYRLDLAKNLFGDVVDHTICMADEDVREGFRARVGRDGPDVVFVCAPARQAQELACEMVAPGGRVNLFGGLPGGDTEIRIDANHLHYAEYTLSGSSSSRQIDNTVALGLLARRVVDPDRLITATYPLAQVAEAFECAQGKACLKVVVQM